MRLSKAQTKYLDRLREAKANYDREIKETETWVKLRREQLKAPLSELVREAIDEGVPARQVALKGLGYADVGSLKQFTEKRDTLPTGWAEMIEATTTSAKVEREKVGALTFAITGEDNDDYMITDEYGDEYRIDLFINTGRGYPSRGFQEDIDKLPEDQRELAKQAVVNAIGETVWQQ